MKTEIIKQINVKIEKDDKELIRKVMALIADLTEIGHKYDCDNYKINGVYRDTGEFEVVKDFLDDLAYAEAVELT